MSDPLERAMMHAEHQKLCEEIESLRAQLVEARAKAIAECDARIPLMSNSEYATGYSDCAQHIKDELATATPAETGR